MNWGKSIVITLLVFMTFIATLVIILSRQQVDLVSEDYYKQEINFQEELEQQQNLNPHLNQLDIRTDETFLIIKLPAAIQIASADIELIRPDNNSEDQSFKFSKTSLCLIPKKDLKSGKYQLIIKFSDQSKSYLYKSTCEI
jgi:hypothetical protein